MITFVLQFWPLSPRQCSRKQWQREKEHYKHLLYWNFHPIESLHTLDEVLNWFKKNNITYVSSIPSCDFEIYQNYKKIFLKKPKGDLYSRLWNQFSMVFNRLGSDGGLFVVIGQKNEYF